jgi:F-type H+-transporting ATPase subunit delta
MKVRAIAARRYGAALHELAAGGAVGMAVAADLEFLKRCATESREFGAFAGNYLVPSVQRAHALEALFAGRLNPLTWRFVRFLETKRRLGLLAEICDDYREREEARQGLLRGGLETAYALEPAEADRLAERVGQWAGRQLALEVRTRPELLGGGRLRLGDRVYDFSVAARLRMLRRTMTAG